MNCSQHLFVPLCQYAVDNKVIRGNGDGIASIVTNLRVASPFSPLTYMDLDLINSLQLFSTLVSGYYPAAWYKSPTSPYGQAAFCSSGAVGEYGQRPIVNHYQMTRDHGNGCKWFFSSDGSLGNNQVLSIFWSEPVTTTPKALKSRKNNDDEIFLNN